MSADIATSATSHALADWAIRTQPCRDERENGDRTVVIARDDGILVAMIDGLGHGAEAARVAEIAAGTITRLADEPIETILAHCHAALVGSRGVALGLAHLARQGSLRWMSVGNVDAAHVSASRGRPSGKGRPALIVPHAGIVGSRLPPVRPIARSLAVDDLVAFATDGLDPSLFDALNIAVPIDISVDRLFERYARPDDDATLAILRWKANAP